MGNSMLLTMGGLALFGTFLLSSHDFLATNMKAADENEYYVTAFALAQSVIDEAKAKAFDQNSVAGPVLTASGMTPVHQLGRDGGAELIQMPDVYTTTGFASTTKFNDIDDYDGYSRIVNTPRANNYRIDVTVCYASEVFPDSAKTFRTMCKKIAVTVSSPFTPFPVALSYAFTY